MMFTFDQVFDQIKQIATDNPDNVADCVYYDMHTDEPVCIVGHWLYQNDLLYPDEWETIEEQNVNGVVSQLSGRLQIDPKAIEFLTDIQSIQDRGIPWGEALDAAISLQE